MEVIRNSYNRLNVLTDDELVPALEDNKKARIDCLTKVFGLNRNLLMSSLESSDVTQVCSTTGETLIIEKVSLLGDLTDVCDNLEKCLTLDQIVEMSPPPYFYVQENARSPSNITHHKR